MINLIYKDLLISKRYILGSICFIIPTMFTTTILDNVYIQSTIIIFTSFILSYIILNSILTKDERNKSELILNSLPVKRSYIIISKYINILFVSSLMWCMQFCTSMIFLNFHIGKHAHYIGIIYLYISILFVVMYFSLYYPMYFKFGSLKLRMFNTIMYLFIIMIPTLIGKFHDSYIMKSIGDLAIRIHNANLSVIFISLILILIFFLSMFSSIKIYSKKEF